MTEAKNALVGSALTIRIHMFLKGVVNVVYAKWTILVLQIDTFANSLTKTPARDFRLESTLKTTRSQTFHGDNLPVLKKVPE